MKMNNEELINSVEYLINWIGEDFEKQVTERECELLTLLEDKMSEIFYIFYSDE